MYETPKLNRVGDVQEVVLGFMAAGDDLDGTYYPVGMAFAEDGDPENTGL